MRKTRREIEAEQKAAAKEAAKKPVENSIPIPLLSKKCGELFMEITFCRAVAPIIEGMEVGAYSSQDIANLFAGLLMSGDVEPVKNIGLSSVMGYRFHAETKKIEIPKKNKTKTDDV